jgi:hypothetical protein
LDQGEEAGEEKRWRTAAIAVVALMAIAVATGARADWIHDADAGEAVEVVDGHKLAISCSGPDDLTVYYAVPANRLEQWLEDPPPLILMMDFGGTGIFGSFNASAVDYGNSVGFGFRGPATRDAARRVAGASRISVGLALRDHGDEFTQYNPSTFSGVGSSKAIRSLLDTCRID